MSRLVANVLYASNGALKSVSKCSTKALMEHYHRWRAPADSAPARAGADAHEALAEYMRGKPTAACLDVFAERYRDWADEHVDPDDRLAWPNLSAILEHWMQTHPHATLPFEPLPDFVEIDFTYPLDDEGTIVLTGRLDAVVRNRDTGDLYVLDHKSTGRMTAQWGRAFRLDSQLTGYLWAAERTLGAPVVGCFINGIEFSRLPVSDRKCSTHGVKYVECAIQHTRSDILITQRTPAQLAEWQRTALHLARRYRDLLERFPNLTDLPHVRMQGTFNNECSWCGLHDFCAAGRPVHLVETLLQHNPWEPPTIVAAQVAAAAEGDNV